MHDQPELAHTYRDCAVLVPCHDEEATIEAVVRSFEASLPGAQIVVCDNASSDRTAQIARACGARVLREPHRGKGFAVRRLFADVDADYYVLVDGDATYDPAAAPEMVRLMRDEDYDTVLGIRRTATESGAAYRLGHELGNTLFSRSFSFLFATNYSDVLTGYRGFSRRFVKSCPVLARGFDVEIELNAHGAALALPTAEIETAYNERPHGSTSKLNTYRDGLRIFRRLFRLYRDYKPMLSFGILAALLAVVGLVAAVPVVVGYSRTGLVQRFPTLFVVVGLWLAALVSLLVAIILERASRDRLERNRLAYLSISRPTTAGSAATSAPVDHPVASVSYR